MKTKNVFILSSLALLFGFCIAWIIKPSNHQAITAPDDHSVTISENLRIYTCAMHPQIRQEEPGDCPICGMDLIPADQGSSDDPLVLEMTTEAVKLANIQTTIVGGTSGESRKTIRLSGKVQADERRASSQVAHVPGRIEKLFVTFTGEQVNKGQKLLTLYSPELITAQRELLEAIKLQNVNPGLIEAARNKLRFWKIAASTIEAIEQKKEIQETFTLYADESGIVTKRRVAVGDYVKVGEALFDLMNLHKVWVLFDAYEEDLTNIRVGNHIEFSTPSVPNKTFKTQITFIDPVINPNTRVTSVRTEVNNKYLQLKPEMFVNGTLRQKTDSVTKLTVPKSAVLWTGTRSVVYVKVPDTAIPSFRFRDVVLGESLGSTYQVMNGLEAGEVVVTYGSFSIDAAAQLNNQVSMMNKNVKLKGADHTDHLPDFTSTTPIEFKHQLADVSAAYFGLKDAFVATDRDQAAKEATQIMLALSKVNISLLKEESHIYWMEDLKALQAHSKKIPELEDVEEQRKQFEFISQSLIKSIKVFGIPEDIYFIQHCPMVNNNTGAVWISREKIIANPYFGDKMLRCGTIQDTITKDYKINEG